jgi:enoyl-CoA hydratase/carnithine racemase
MQGLVLTEIVGGVGVITLNRPKALNALNLAMVRELRDALDVWRHDAAVHAVMLQGSARTQPDGTPGARHFCAGGDIRFMHEAATTADLTLDDFFTEEYALDHVIHAYPKPVIAWLEGIVMGGGMGLAQGATLRVATAGIKMAMPETRIGLFPDVAGGHFLSRLPGATGEYLGVVGQAFGAGDALHWGLADLLVPDTARSACLQGLQVQPVASGEEALARVKALACEVGLAPRQHSLHQPAIDRHFSLPGVQAIVHSLQADDSAWAQAALAHLAGNSPLMMAVTLRQIREARTLPLAEVFRLERNLVRQCFAVRKGHASETVEGVRALAVDKDHQPRWQPATLAEVTSDHVQAYFEPAWPAHAHPLRDLVDLA